MSTRDHPPRAHARRRTPRRRTAAALALAVAGALSAGTLGATGASASSHREAPGVAATPQLDTTDVYAFHSPDKPGTVTLLANWLPFSEPAGGPNFYLFDDKALYDIAVDTNGDARPDIVYRWTFTTHVRNPATFLYNTGPVTSLDDPDLNIRQTYKLQVLRAGAWSTIRDGMVAAPSNVGRASMPDYASLRRQSVYTAGGRTTFAGQADDPFFLDLRVFNLLYNGDLSEVGNDTLRGYDVNTTAIQVPVAELGGPGNIAGIWSRTYKKDSNGVYRQVSRLGSPLVNEVVVPLKDKDRFNASSPSNDAQFLQYVTNPVLPPVVEAVYGIKAPATPRNDLVQVFLTGVPGLNQPANVRPSEMIRLNLTPFPGQTFSRLGVIGGDKNGYPNGRRLADDTLDISLQVVEGELVGSPNDLGDAVDANDVPFEDVFPYVGLPTSGSTSVNSGGGTPYPGTDGGADAASASAATVLTGGADGSATAAGATDAVPSIPAPATTAALLALLAAAAAVLTRQRRRVTRPVTSPSA
ncbi:DUF4331 domain-containing protein [Cellulomonas sp. NPDC055163]